MRAAKDWHKGFFRNSFYNPASEAAVEKAPAEAAFVQRKLKLKKGAALLDLCCGPGRHAVEFARKGLAVTGYDYSGEYLKEAAGRAAKKKVGLRLVRGDMRKLKFRSEFDAAVNLFTSFGYFLKFSDDMRTLKGVARALRPGGLFLIDIINGACVKKNFRANSWCDMGDYYHLEQAELTADGVHNAWTRVPKRGGKTASRTFFTRLYDKKRLGAALCSAGLKPLSFWGNFRGAPLSDERNRLICLARKA
ncbi:MAG: class I SAM-dependent methyltransferase [Elusimicrobia bacterium]|nr:class I SAM-dependent methyltransferase [Elusimicrobiota bacterium]